MTIKTLLKKMKENREKRENPYLHTTFRNNLLIEYMDLFAELKKSGYFDGFEELEQSCLKLEGSYDSACNQ